jgi:hypothetical protein
VTRREVLTGPRHGRAVVDLEDLLAVGEKGADGAVLGDAKLQGEPLDELVPGKLEDRGVTGEAGPTPPRRSG